eukprot:1178829-Prorocentrum_minimum.AAC.2
MEGRAIGQSGRSLSVTPIESSDSRGAASRGGEGGARASSGRGGEGPASSWGGVPGASTSMSSAGGAGASDLMSAGMAGPSTSASAGGVPGASTSTEIEGSGPATSRMCSIQGCRSACAQGARGSEAVRVGAGWCCAGRPVRAPVRSYSLVPMVPTNPNVARFSLARSASHLVRGRFSTESSGTYPSIGDG